MNEIDNGIRNKILISGSPASESYTLTFELYSDMPLGGKDNCDVMVSKTFSIEYV